MKPVALLDSNVLIAMLAEAHEHHAPSLALLAAEDRTDYAIAARSYAEAYSTLTRRGERSPFHFPADEAWAALESVRAVTALVGLTPARAFDTIRGYAHDGGIGPRLYDRLIGETALAYDIPAVITWNVGHMRSLFPRLAIATPRDFRLPATRADDTPG